MEWYNRLSTTITESDDGKWKGLKKLQVEQLKIYWYFWAMRMSVNARFQLIQENFDAKHKIRRYNMACNTLHFSIF